MNLSIAEMRSTALRGGMDGEVVLLPTASCAGPGEPQRWHDAAQTPLILLLDRPGGLCHLASSHGCCVLGRPKGVGGTCPYLAEAVQHVLLGWLCWPPCRARSV